MPLTPLPQYPTPERAATWHDDAQAWNAALVRLTAEWNAATPAESAAALAQTLAGHSPGEGAALIGGLIADSVTLAVPSQYATISAALTYLSSKTIARDATVTIKVADGMYVPVAGVNLNHPQGARIQIVGNEANPAACVLRPAAPTFDLFTVSAGHVFGKVAGITFDLPTKAGAANNVTAILATHGGRIAEVANCKVNNWYYSIAARDDGYIYAHDCVCDHAGDVAIWAFAGGVIHGHNLTAQNANDSANGLGYGFQAEYGGTLNANNSTATGCHIGGFAALSNGTGRYYDCLASGNAGSGFVVRGGGVIEANGSTTQGNTRYGIEYFGAGTLTGLSVNSGNALGVDNGALYIDQGPLGARLAGNGPVRLDANGANPIYLNTGGGLQAEIRHQAGATSRVFLQGGNSGTADQPLVGVDGAAADISVRWLTKGTGSHYFFTGSGLQASVFDTPGSTDWLGLTGGVGLGRIQAVGASADVDLMLAPKGAGRVRFGTHSAGGVSANGYVEWKLADGATVRVPAQRL